MRRLKKNRARRRERLMGRRAPWVDPAVARRDAGLVCAARLVGRGRIKRALRRYLGLLAETPDDLALINRTGDVLVRGGQLARAIEHFERVGRGYRAAGFSAKAIAIYRKILRLVPDHREAYAELMRIYREQGLDVEAWAAAGRLLSCRARRG